MNDSFKFKTLIPHIIAIVLFLAVPYIYEAPVMEGKVLQANDVMHGIGNNKELRDYREANGEEALWNSRLFSGMPAFQMSIKHSGNIGEKINSIFNWIGPGSIVVFFMMSVSFYILMLVLGVNPWVAMIFAFGFSFSTFNMVSIEAGHVWKIKTLALAPGIIAGVLLVFQKKYLSGAALMSLFLCAHLTANHFQITYYLLLFLLVYGVYEFINHYKQKTLPEFGKIVGVLLIAGLIGAGPTFGKLWSTMEYSKETIRGGSSELSLAKNAAENKSSGLDKDYAMRWSYGIMESFTMIIPYFSGGASVEELGRNSNLAKANFPKQYLKQVPTYWGDQPFTAGPVYLGASIIFLFFFGLFLLKGSLRNTIIFCSIWFLILSWGSNFDAITGLFFKYFPLFNKFRTPSMILLMHSLMFPIIGAVAINRIIKKEVSKDEIFKALKWSGIISLGILIVFGFLGSFSYDFSSANDARLIKQGWPIEALINDRVDMLRGDTYRSLFFIILCIGAIFMYYRDKLKLEYFIGVLGLLILIDLWGIDKRYLNEDKFKKPRDVENFFNADPVDQQILQDKSYYRVFNLSVNPFTDARTSYHHRSIGGYHAAKLVRYQELIENQLSKQNMQVLNMLNAKYFIVPGQNKYPIAQQNPEANGVGWFPKNLKWVNNANEEMLALNDFNSKSDVIIDNRFKEYTAGLSDIQSGQGSIQLDSYDPKKMIYSVTNNGTSDQLVVFSEVYYEGGHNDWKVFIDGQETKHIRVNYIIRGLRVPPGSHNVEFRFEPRSYILGNNISKAFSGLLILLVLGALFQLYREHTKNVTEEDSLAVES